MPVSPFQNGDFKPTRVDFEALPEVIRLQFHHDPIIYMWVNAWLHGRIDRASMMEGIACAQTEKSRLISAELLRFHQWFGTPPETIIVPKS